MPTVELPMVGEGYATRGNFVCCASVDFPEVDFGGLNTSAVWASASTLMSEAELREFHASHRENIAPYTGWKFGCGDIGTREKDGVAAANEYATPCAMLQ